MQDPPGPHGPRLEAALPGARGNVVVVRWSRDCRLGVVPLIYARKVVGITLKKSNNHDEATHRTVN